VAVGGTCGSSVSISAGCEASPFDIARVRFESPRRVPEIVKTVPHLAFAVDDLERVVFQESIDDY